MIVDITRMTASELELLREQITRELHYNDFVDDFEAWRRNDRRLRLELGRVTQQLRSIT